jgi:RES domain-containing protein
MASTPEPLFSRVERRFWRVLAPRWAHQPLSGEDAARNGGRWNPKGVPALYLSGELTTAVAEYEQDIGIRPGTFCAYDVKVERILDLTSADVLELLGIDPADRHAAWKTILLVERRVPAGLAYRRGSDWPGWQWRAGSVGSTHGRNEPGALEVERCARAVGRRDRSAYGPAARSDVVAVERREAQRDQSGGPFLVSQRCSSSLPVSASVNSSKTGAVRSTPSATRTEPRWRPNKDPTRAS